MRVTQQMLFGRYINNLNMSLTELMDLNMKAQTQKKINKPSDDPTGMTRILDHRDTLRSLGQYEENISTAKGWLTSSDEALMQTSTILTRAKELATQAATGTVDENNREQISYELRSLFEQLIGLANTSFEDKSIYAGQETGQPAFKEIMWLTTNDDDFSRSTDFTIMGSSDKTVLVEFYDSSGTLSPGDSMNLSNASLSPRYSVDGGRTWLDDATISGTGPYTVNLPQSGTSVTFHNNASVKVGDADDPTVADGTWMWIRPSAQYLGDDEDPPPDVAQLGLGRGNVDASASGAFLDGAVTVRIDNDSAVKMNGRIEYSYSLDGGINWVTGNIAPADSTSNAAVLGVANGGILTLTSNGNGNSLQPGQQFIIRPHVSAINMDISASEAVKVNDVGKDIFGGIYMNSNLVQNNNGEILTLGSSNAGRVFHSNSGTTYRRMGVSIQGDDEASKNLFEVMGNLVAFAETNNQTGVQQMLANLSEVQAHIMNKAADVGGRENRLEVSQTIIDGLTLNEQTLLSSIEDADVSELMTELAQQQIVYESVLRSTSMIMQLNLGKFI